MQRCQAQPSTFAIAAFRAAWASASNYDEQLMVLGFKKPARRTINFPVDNPYYDMLLASGTTPASTVGTERTLCRLIRR